MERADALAEERAALTNYVRNTLITNELKFKEVRQHLGDGGSLMFYWHACYQLITVACLGCALNPYMLRYVVVSLGRGLQS